MPAYSINQIAEHVDGQVSGPADLTVTGIEILNKATHTQLSFIRSAKFAEHWGQSKAGVILLSKSIEIPSHCADRSAILVDDADLALNKVIELFAPDKLCPAPGVHPTAVIADSAQIGKDCCIGPHCVIGDNVVLGDGCILHDSVSLHENSTFGAHCEFFSGVIVRERSVIGNHVIIHSNAVIGADGFGYRPSEDGRGIVKIPHIGHVIIGNGVEIGANACIDRAKFSATVIGDGTKIDNLCQIAHNVTIGRMCLIAAQCGIAGSTTIGDGVQIGGQAGLRDNINVGSGVKLGACSAVMCDIPAGETWMGVPAREQSVCAREVVAARKLPEIVKAYKEFTKQMKSD
ncbi:MAG: UDP-3-O-(3-hydroxymyristoyl)glucosamine N-acyltransferase [Phycisphaeraceae bacterium JB051]